MLEFMAMSSNSNLKLDCSLTLAMCWSGILRHFYFVLILQVQSYAKIGASLLSPVSARIDSGINCFGMADNLFGTEGNLDTD